MNPSENDDPNDPDDQSQTHVAETDRRRIADIVWATDNAAAVITAEGYDAFMASVIYEQAAVAILARVGEAAKALSEEFKGTVPDQPWTEIARMRDLLVHRYWEIDWDIVWQSISDDLPALRDALADATNGEDS